MAATAGESRVLPALTVIPGALAVGLAVLYAAGAIQAFGQLNAAGIKPTDFLPLIPLEQLLGRGIGALMVPAAVTLFLVLLFLILHEDDATKPDEQGRGSAGTFRVTLSGRQLTIMGALAIASMLLSLEPGLTASLILMAASFLLLGFLLRRSRIPTGPATALLLVTTQLVYVVSIAILIPEPLPLAVVDLRDAPGLEGELVLDTADSVYVQTDERVVSVGSDQVVSLAIESRDRDPSVSPIDWLLGRDR